MLENAASRSVAFTSVSVFIDHACHFSNKPFVSAVPAPGGLFPTKPIKKGRKIIPVFGPIWDCRKKKKDAIENKHRFELNGRWTIDGSVRKNIARYINHACKPNAESDVKAAQAQGPDPRHQEH